MKTPIVNRTEEKVRQSFRSFHENLAQLLSKIQQIKNSIIASMSVSTTTRKSFWYCDQCSRTLSHGETRYNCTVCYDYDYCESCATILEPPHPHRMVPELAYGRVEKNKRRIKDMTTAIRAALHKYWDRHCIGTRDVDKDDPSIYTDTYSWLTFKTIADRSKHFGRGLRQIIQPRDYLAICAANRPEWVITDFACIFQSFISVPIYTSFTDQEIVYVINNTNVSVVVCDKHMLPRFIDMRVQCPSLKHIVCMDPVTESESNGLSLHYMGDIESKGSVKKHEYVETAPNDCLTIIYTSGSSGFPKGAMVSEKAFRAAFPQKCSSSTADYIHYSYRPLAWAADRDAVIITFLHGGRTAFSTGDLSRLMEELALVRPSDFIAAPSIWNKIYTEFKTALALITARCPPETIPEEEKRLLEQFSKLMPNRCKMITTGGAMTSPVVLDFIKRCFTCCTVYESYGISECGGIAYDNVVESSVEYRLESVPDMNYTIDDQPHARGELLIKTPELFSGYINNPEETRASITDDGFFRTGDIVELSTDQHGRTNFKIIDRKKSFFKLAQGQFVSPERLQNIYLQSAFVDQIYIHGDLLADSVYAVVVPSQHHLSNIKDAVLQDLRSIGERESLRPHEIPSQLIIDFDPFTPENGLLTSSLKHCRPKLAAHYAHRFTKSNNIQQRLKTIIQAVTGQSIDAEEDDEKTFVSVGGDSLAAVRLSRMIENDLGVSLPLNILFNPKMNLQQLTAHIQHPSSIVPPLLQDASVDLNISVDGWKSSGTSPSLVLVTGSTGFVGAFLLAELLRSHSNDCKFVCLVRCDVSIDPLHRIRETMLFYQIWHDDYQHRIHALRGDLAEHYLGLADEMYESLTEQVDVIYHCGAGVNFVLPYSHLYGPNVCGTREIIRFAAHKSSSCIPIHYISTISVLSDGVEKEVCIDEIRPDELVSGYAQSKWVAEKLMWRASVMGMPVMIYRLGLVCADSRSGACNPRDLYTLLFDGMMKMGCYPESAKNGCVSGLPVDFVAKSVVHISRFGVDLDGKVYHVVNSSDGIDFEKIIDGMRRCGLEMKRVTDDEWNQKLDNENGRLGFLFDNVFSQPDAVSGVQFQKAICSLDYPSMDGEYLFRWLHFVSDHINRK